MKRNGKAIKRTGQNGATSPSTRASQRPLRARSGAPDQSPVPTNGHETLQGAPPMVMDAAHIQALEQSWRGDARWEGVTRPYTAEKILLLRGSLKIEHTIADEMSRKLWRLLRTEPFVPALGALTGNQAVQMVQAGLKAIYLS